MNFSQWYIYTHMHIYTQVAVYSNWKEIRALKKQVRCVVCHSLSLWQKNLIDLSSPFIEHQVEKSRLERSLLVCFDTYCVSYHHISFVVFYLVIRAKVKEVKTKCHDVTAVVEVKEILKASLVNIPKDTINLYTSSGCLCPPLNVNEEYIIMGYEDEERSR